MAVTKAFPKAYGQFLANGSTPKIAPQNNTMSAIPTGTQLVTSLRLRTDIEMYVLAVGTGSANINLAVAYETIMVVGAIGYESGKVTNSATPLSDTSPPPVTGSLGGWGQWEYLYPTVDFINIVTPQVALITWRPKDKTIDTQFRRAAPANNGIDLFMPWEIQDGSGLINTSTGGVTYNLGVRFAQSWLYELKS